ncbi:DUF3182 family protein [Variovorax sp. SG517]|uniref:DUF3182 family protein n=1 Tax=Variovorax sp. SG517 TaxID=2587117 RepID=UPI0035237E57
MQALPRDQEGAGPVDAPEEAGLAPGPCSVLTWDVDPRGYCSEHEHATRANYGQRLAALMDCAFAGEYDEYGGARQAGGSSASPASRHYFVPSDTLSDPVRARAMGIAGVDDLFGGVVPHAFVATKVISHPLIDDGSAARPKGWSTRFASEVGEAVLPGYSCFSADEAARAGHAMLEAGAVRLKPVTATGGRGQIVAESAGALEASIGAMDPAEIARTGLVLEANLEDPVTWSVGQVLVAGMVVSYCGVQRTTGDNAGQEVYGGSDLMMVRGDFDVLIAGVASPSLRRAIEQARRYHRAVIDCYPGFFASRVNYDVAQGVDGRGEWRSGVLEQSWRVGGATGAEIAGLEVFHRDPARGEVRASCFEVYGPSVLVPADAIVAYQGTDSRVGPLVKYTILPEDRHADAP